MIPVLTPFILLPTLWILRRFFQDALERVNSALVTLIIFGATAAGTYWMFEESPREYVGFLAERGFETDATVLAIQHGDSFLYGGAYDDVEISYRDEAGFEQKASYVSLPRRFYPAIQEPIVPPDAGDKLRIRFFPTVETGFIVLTNAKKSTYGAKLECNEALLVLTTAQLRYRHDDFPTVADRAFLKAAIDAILPLDCIDLKERDQLRDLKEKLK